MAENATSPSKKSRRMVPLRYVLTPIVIIMLAIVVLIALAILAPKPAKKPITLKAPLVDIISVSSSSVEFSIASQGSVVPRTQTQLISEVSGMVTQVSDKFVVGGFFEKGEELLRIDDITYQVAVLQAESRLGAAESTLVTEQAQAKQAEDEWLLTGKPIAEAPILALRIPQLQQAKANLIAAQADLKEAQTKLARTKIIAPYDAMLKAKQVDIGQYVTVGSALAETFAVDYAEVRLPVKQRDVAFLNLPKINQVQTEASDVEIFYQLDGKKHVWPSQIARYEGVVDTASRVHYIVAKLDDPYGMKAEQGKQANEEIRIGTFVNANISGKQLEDVVAIPREAVHGANMLYTVDRENKLRIMTFDVLRTDIDYVYTQQPLSRENRIIVTNLETPVEGMNLRINGEQKQQVNTSDEESLSSEESASVSESTTSVEDSISVEGSQS